VLSAVSGYRMTQNVHGMLTWLKTLSEKDESELEKIVNLQFSPLPPIARAGSSMLKHYCQLYAERRWAGLTRPTHSFPNN
jgi:hypothetical protein